MAVDFERAKQIVREKLVTDWPDVYIASWGWETEDLWIVTANDRRCIEQSDMAYCVIRSGSDAVKKDSGEYVWIGVENLSILDEATPVGDVPDPEE